MAQTQMAALGRLELRLGGVLADARLAYCSYGQLAPDGRNAILVTHGFTSSHQFIEGGGWGSLLGAGQVLDTDRFFVVSSNMLGSSYGSTGPASIDPARGRPYGPEFPPITVADMVVAQRRMLEGLGVRQLVAVIGPSYGGFQAFTWGVEFPDFMRGLVPVESAPRAQTPFDDTGLLRRLAADPHWNGGQYYGESAGVRRTMTGLRIDTLRRYGAEQGLRAQGMGPQEIEADLLRQARPWADAFDAHSLLALGRAINRYDVTDRLGQIRARVLYLLSRTDGVFPPSLAPPVMDALRDAGVDARYAEIDTEHGHLGSDIDVARWAPRLSAFLDGLAR
jgi:homoserine O-acetyltransferase